MINKRIGILGGGQLGKMLYQAATRMSLDISFMDQSKSFPVGQICPNFTEGNFKDYDDIMAFGQDKDVISIEIEAVNTRALKDLEASGKLVFPQASVISLIQDKGLQKEFFSENSLPSSEFSLYESDSEINSAISNGTLNLPFVQKLRKDGYDGKGVQVIKDRQDLSKLFEVPSLVENLVDIDKEIAVIIARQSNERISVYDPVEMVFDPVANLLDYQIAPAHIDQSLVNKAKELAIQTAHALGIVGIMAVEMFIDKNQNILINELAPRPHNSGHHTIEAAQTSQYEQHLRCILGMPLGNPALLSPSLLMNVLGEENNTGKAIYQGMEDCLAIDNVNIHLYGKDITKPHRKMGHINIVDQNLDKALEKYSLIRKTLKVVSNE